MGSQPFPIGSKPSSIEAADGELVDLLEHRLIDFGAQVHRCKPDRAAVCVGSLMRSHRCGVAAVSADLDRRLRPEGIELIEDRGLPPAVLSEVPAAITKARLAVARTGTLLFDCGPGQGRRLLTLLPDVHVAIVEATAVVWDVPEALSALSLLGHPPITLTSGPSATSDIELSRVEGVHGPRRLAVVVLEQ